MRISGVCVELGKLDHANELRQSGGMGGAVQRRMFGRRGRLLRLGVERRLEEGNECDIRNPTGVFRQALYQSNERARSLEVSSSRTCAAVGGAQHHLCDASKGGMTIVGMDQLIRPE